MKKNPKIIYFLLTLIIIIGVFLYFQEHDSKEEGRSVNGMEKIPPAETVTLNREGDSTVIKVKEEQPVMIPVSQFKDDKLTMSSVPAVPTREDSVDLEEHSYSIKNKKKEIILSPGVSLQPSKGITIKIPGEEEVIKVQRDKTYHPDSIHMFWEKKY